MHQHPWQLEWRLAFVTQAAAHRQTVRAHDVCFGILALRHFALNLTYTPHILLELGLGVPISIQDRLARLLQIMVLAQLMRDAWQDLLHGKPDRALTIRDHGMDRHRQPSRHLAQHVAQVGFASTVEATGKQNVAREAIAEHPQHVLMLVGLEAVDGQDDMTLLRETVFEAGLVGEAQGEQLLVAL
jgi:hypothetical protein